ncbi:DUF4190 domain-containing protein [Nocardioides silvaticus]|nr:DUF4190 domain-containing protein [Nocardioides silvaticus]
MSNEPPPYGSPPPPPPPGGGGYGAPPPGGGYGGYGGPPPGGGYGGYGQPPGFGPQQSTSVMAIISLVTGILGILCCGWFIFSIAALILGFLGRNEINQSQGTKKGAGLALAGLILGAVGMALGILNWVLILATDASYFYFG